jgi:hypothetical protein
MSSSLPSYIFASFDNMKSPDPTFEVFQKLPMHSLQHQKKVIHFQVPSITISNNEQTYQNDIYITLNPT